MRFAQILSLVACLGICTSSRGDDWPDWGGPQRDLVWREKGIVRTLPKDKDGLMPRMWCAPLADGYPGPAGANRRVYITDRPDAGTERVFCLDAETGKEIW